MEQTAVKLPQSKVLSEHNLKKLEKPDVNKALKDISVGEDLCYVPTKLMCFSVQAKQNPQILPPLSYKPKTTKRYFAQNRERNSYNLNSSKADSSSQPDLINYDVASR